jgi:NAD(P)-dependent dehydrogenase (short-subunit alcohol dehydrogenase family)
MLTKECLPYLRNSSFATIVNIASVTAHVGYENQSAYSASKHALLGMTRALAKEVYKEGIRVHAVSPGGVYTDMIKITRPDLTPDGMIMPEDVADIVMFFITHRTNAVIDEIELHRATKQPF